MSHYFNKRIKLVLTCEDRFLILVILYFNMLIHWRWQALKCLLLLKPFLKGTVNAINVPILSDICIESSLVDSSTVSSSALLPLTSVLYGMIEYNTDCVLGDVRSYSPRYSPLFRKINLSWFHGVLDGAFTAYCSSTLNSVSADFVRSDFKTDPPASCSVGKLDGFNTEFIFILRNVTSRKFYQKLITSTRRGMR